MLLCIEKLRDLAKIDNEERSVMKICEKFAYISDVISVVDTAHAWEGHSYQSIADVGEICGLKRDGERGRINRK